MLADQGKAFLSRKGCLQNLLLFVLVLCQLYFLCFDVPGQPRGPTEAAAQKSHIAEPSRNLLQVEAAVFVQATPKLTEQLDPSAAKQSPRQETGAEQSSPPHSPPDVRRRETGAPESQQTQSSSDVVQEDGSGKRHSAEEDSGVPELQQPQSPSGAVQEDGSGKQYSIEEDSRFSNLIPFGSSAFSGVETITASEADTKALNYKVYRLANESNYWSRIGYCRHGSSLLPDVRDDACTFRTCVGHNGNYYDISRLILGADVAHLPSKVEGCYEASGGQIYEASRGQVSVSFIYTVFNRPVMLAQALLATFRTAHEISSAEFVVLDDGSTEDMTPVVRVLDTLSELFGTKIVRKRSPTPLGFATASVAALKLATGLYACTMDSDVFPLPGWLALLYSTIRSYPGAGMVGPMQLDPKGRVMEVGGTIFRQGHPYRIGSPHWPWELPFLHAHVVDYASVACLLFDRLEFLRLGLFDPLFGPTYMDADAALTMRASGKLVVSQPLSAVVRVEGRAHSGDASEKAMAESEARLQAKHGSSLELHCPSPRGEYQTCGSLDDIDTAMDFNIIRRQGAQVLVVDFVVPEIDKESGSVRMKELLQIIVDMGYGITLQPDSVNSFGKYVLPMLAMGVHVMPPGALKAMAAKVRANLRSDLAICPWQVAIVSRRAVFHSQIAALQTLCPKIPLIYDTVDLHFVRERRSVELAIQTGDQAPVFLGDGFVDVHKTPREDVEKLLKEGEALEVGFMQMSQYVLVVGSGEVAVAGERVGESKVRLLTNIYPDPDRTAPFTAWSDRVGGLFVGSMCHTPNIDASKFIMREILKDNHDEFPKGFVHLVWSGTDRCRALVGSLLEEARNHPLITLHLDVTNEELFDLHMRAKFFLGALRVGAGVKGKLCMALLYGLPIVGSDVATEGMFLESERNVLSASKPEEYISQIRRLQTSEELWMQLRSEGFSVIERHFSRTAARNTLQEMFSSLSAPPRIQQDASGKLWASQVWECPLPEDAGGKKGLFPGRLDADCWSTIGHNPFVLPVPSSNFEDHFVADHIPRPRRVRDVPDRCPVSSTPSAERPFIFHNLINAGGGSIKRHVMESSQRGGLVAGSNCEGKTDCRCNAMYQTPLAQLATCGDSEDFTSGQVFLGAFAPLPLERLHPVGSNDKTCFIFLRTPLKRAMSHYYKYDVFQGYGNRHQDELSFNELEESFRRTGGGEFMTRFLGCEDDEQCAQPIDKIAVAAKQELRRCHVGIAEHFKSSIAYLKLLAPWLDLESIPRPNRPAVFVDSTTTFAKFPPETQQAVRKWFEVDDAVFAHGKSLFANQVRSAIRCAGEESNGEDVAEQLSTMRDLASSVRGKDQAEQWKVAGCMERVVSCREGPLRDKCQCSQKELAEATASERPNSPEGIGF